MTCIEKWRLGVLTVLVLLPGMEFIGAAETPFLVLMRDHAARPAPDLSPPALHQTIKDPVFGTYVTRISDPSQSPGRSRIRHYYSKANPFNADETRALLFGSDGSVILYDAKAWKPIKDLHVTSSDPEAQWHPTDPNILYHMGFVGNSPNVRGFYRYDIRSDKRTLLRDFSEYDTARGRLEGNMDKSGRYYALFGWHGKKIVEAFVYDVQENKVSRKLPVDGRMADDWISVSPSGRYVVMMGKDRSRVYDINMNHVVDLPKGSFGHADICLLADGSEALVYDGADHQLDHNAHRVGFDAACLLPQRRSPGLGANFYARAGQEVSQS